VSELRIAIDGPSGTGKSTVSRRVALALGAAYLDTGSMYRIATLGVLRAGVDPADAAAVAKCVANLDWSVGTDPAAEHVEFDGENVGDEIRGAAVSSAVSLVAKVPEVRGELVLAQRRIAGAHPRMVMEGRDIGTVVLTDAEVKVFLTASAQARAQRRNRQNIEEGRGDDYAAVLANVQQRDHIDSTREVSPLRPADDAVVLDTSELDIDDVTARLLQLARAAEQKEGRGE
jgi:cytidylate kinase